MTRRPETHLRPIVLHHRRPVYALCACTGPQLESGPVRVVGSSTLFPFAAKAAETYSQGSGTPMVVEQTGSGGGHKLFCSGDPDIPCHDLVAAAQAVRNRTLRPQRRERRDRTASGP